MRAVVFDLSLARAAAAMLAGRLVPSLYDGAPSCLSLRDDVPEPRLPGDDWVRLRPLFAGVCGTDVATVYFKASPALSPYASSPFIPGHEILARVEDVGGSVTHVKPGDRVVVDPWLSCELRGAPACDSCASDAPQTCLRAGLGPRRGMCLGFCAELPGGWGEVMVAHESQLFHMSDSVPDERAVLAEPCAVSVHAVLQAAPQPGQRVLVLGGGPIAFTTALALRELCDDVDITLFTLEAQQAALAVTLGAHRAWTPQDGDLITLASQLVGGVPLSPTIGPAFLAGGFDMIFDCVGSVRSFGDAMRLAAPRAQIIMIGGAGAMQDLDLSHLWTKELRVHGTVAYGSDPYRGELRRTFAITRELLEQTKRPVQQLVTHEYELADYARALRETRDRHLSGTIKTVLRIE